MESTEQLKLTEQEVHPPLPADNEPKSVSDRIPRPVSTVRREIAAQALKELWQGLHLDGTPLIFISPIQGRMQIEHHPMLLNQLAAGSKQQKKMRLGHLQSWEHITPPEFAQGIATIGEVNVLLKSDLLRPAEIGDRDTIPSAPYGWICYTFQDDWKALSVFFADPDSNDTVTLTAIPMGRQDDWLAFLKLLDELHKSIWRKDHRGRIEIIGGDDEFVDAIKDASFEDLVLPEETLAYMAAQRRIFDDAILRRYEALHLPRLRKVLLIGPPGTGKTSLLKAEGALHAKQGGLVIYVSATPLSRNTSSWQHLAQALHVAKECRLPTLILVEDFELFVSNPPDLQFVLTMLHGVATPDNPAGTLLLATSNEPEKIDPRIRERPGRIDAFIEIGLVEDTGLAVRFLQHFLGAAYSEEEHASVAPKLLKQSGSHFREVCIAGTMHALEKGRSNVLGEDLLWAHEMILAGRAIAAEPERFSSAANRKRLGYFRNS